MLTVCFIQYIKNVLILKISKNKINKIKLTRVFIFTILSTFVLSVFLLFFLFIFSKSFLKSDKFKVATEEKIDQILKAKGSFAELNWSGTSVFTDNYFASGSNKSFFSKIRANGVRADFNIGAIKRRAWELSNVSVNQLNVSIDSEVEGFEYDDQITENDIGNNDEGWFKRFFLPNRVLINTIGIGELNFDFIAPQHDISGRDISLNATKGPNQQLYKLETFNGIVWLNDFPKLHLKGGTLRLLPDQLIIDGIDFIFYEKSKARVFGNIRKDSDIINLNIDSKLSNIPAEKILTDDWIKKLKGQVDLDLNLTGRLNSYKLAGKASLINGQLEAVPILESVDDILGTSKFRKLILNEFNINFTSSDLNEIKIDQFYTHSYGTVCVTGNFLIKNKEVIEGVYMLGVTPETLKWLSTSKKEVLENVFSINRDDALRTVFNSEVVDKKSIRIPPQGFRWAVCRVNPNSIDPFSSDIRQQFVRLGGLALWGELVGVREVGLEAFDLLTESALNKNLDLNSLIKFEEGMFSDDSLMKLADELGVSEKMGKIIEGVSDNSLIIPDRIFKGSRSLLDDLFFSK